MALAPAFKNARLIEEIEMQSKSLTHEEIAILVKYAGLDLTQEHFDEMTKAYADIIEPILARLRRGRARADEPAHTFDPRNFMPLDD